MENSFTVHCLLNSRTSNAQNQRLTRTVAQLEKQLATSSVSGLDRTLSCVEHMDTIRELQARHVHLLVLKSLELHLRTNMGLRFIN